MNRRGPERYARSMRPTRVAVWCVVVVYLAIFAACTHVGAQVPERCYQYQKYLTQQARTVFGVDAPIAALAAQIQQESGCNALAVSPVGAQGLTQFMPATARELAQRYPTELGPADPNNWKWAIAAQVRYMHDLVPRPWRTPCDWYAAKLSAYNGGEGWLNRDVAMCRLKPIDVANCDLCVADLWWENVELTPDRRRAAQYIRENRDYSRRILLTLEPLYVDALWGDGACHASK